MKVFRMFVFYVTHPLCVDRCHIAYTCTVIAQYKVIRIGPQTIILTFETLIAEYVLKSTIKSIFMIRNLTT